jgi:hypothetical protein
MKPLPVDFGYAVLEAPDVPLGLSPDEVRSSLSGDLP